MAEEITTTISRIRRLFVIARNSTFACPIFLGRGLAAMLALGLSPC